MSAADDPAIVAARKESAKIGAWNYVPGTFRERFVSPFEQYRDRIGQPFTVVRQLPMEEVSKECGVPEDECQDMYVIRFADGAGIVAWGEEVCVADKGRWSAKATPGQHDSKQR